MSIIKDTLRRKHGSASLVWMLSLAACMLRFASSIPARAAEVETLKIDGVIHDFVMAPDGRWICLLTKNGHVVLWDVIKSRSTVLSKNGVAFWGGFSSKSDLLGIFTRNQLRTVWQLGASGTWARSPDFKHFELPGWSLRSEHAVFEPNADKCLCLTCFKEGPLPKFIEFVDYRVLRCDCRTGASVPSKLKPFDDLVCDLAVSPDGRRLCIAHWEFVEMFDLTTGKAMHEHRTFLAKLTFSPDSRLAAATQWIEPTDGRPDRCEILVWKVEDGKEVAAFDLGTQQAIDTVFTRDAKQLVFAGAARSISMLPIQTGARPQTIPQDHRVDCIRQLGDQRLIAFEKSKGILKWWDATASLEAVPATVD